MKLTPKQERFVQEYCINIERFWEKVDIRGDEDCWNFKTSLDRNGYGRLHIGLSRNSTMLAHRIAYGFTHGYLPQAVCHKCDNPSCCNPKHLFGGTKADNNRDMARKGRNRVPKPTLRGEGHHQAKITNDQALEIRKRYSTGMYTQREIAAEYGVSQRTITKIVRQESFQNV